jgi:hypothetical protein
MNRRKVLQALAALPAAAAFPMLAAPAKRGKGSIKKGWAGANEDAIKTFGAHWYYNWTLRDDNIRKAEFVPMIKRGADMVKAENIRGIRNIKAVLGLNEPERETQGNTTIEEAIKLWPQLVKIAEKEKLRIGSPAPSSDKLGMDWFNEFMKRAKKEKLRVDFVAIHWYRGRNADAFANWLKELDREWGIPIWLTEFNGWSGTEEENYDFLKEALKTLEREKYVERYAYFEPGKGKDHSLFKADGSLSRMGELYRDAGI